MKSLDDAVALTNQLAPEHCEVMTRNPRKVSERILTAGAIFLGPWSPTVLGDYVAGPSHTLPTGGAGASFAGLTVDQFQRRTSVVNTLALHSRRRWRRRKVCRSRGVERAWEVSGNKASLRTLSVGETVAMIQLQMTAGQ